MASGSWPAFWMLPEGTLNRYGGWCSSGEIDIMEHKNNITNIEASLHYGGTVAANYQNCRSISKTTAFNATALAANDGWHTVALEWSRDQIRFYANGPSPYQTVSIE
jgi:beta-glucanase (GH16 family)